MEELMTMFSNIEALALDSNKNNISLVNHNDTSHFNNKNTATILSKNTTIPNNPYKTSTINITVMHRMMSREQIELNKVNKRTKFGGGRVM